MQDASLPFFMQVALQQSATDPNTGTIDMDCITTGMTSSDRRAQEQLANELRELLTSKYSIHSCLVTSAVIGSTSLLIPHSEMYST